MDIYEDINIQCVHVTNENMFFGEMFYLRSKKHMVCRLKIKLTCEMNDVIIINIVFHNEYNQHFSYTYSYAVNLSQS